MIIQKNYEHLAPTDSIIECIWYAKGEKQESSNIESWHYEFFFVFFLRCLILACSVEYIIRQNSLF